MCSGVCDLNGRPNRSLSDTKMTGGHKCKQLCFLENFMHELGQRMRRKKMNSLYVTLVKICLNTFIGARNYGFMAGSAV
jgi:hypothetical protein